jgi:V/A-type H+-transporting ATPase subunit D
MREGYTLLEQKRQILIVELMGLIDKTADAQESVEKKLKEAYAAFQETIVRMGKNSIGEFIPSLNIDSQINISMRRLMGVNIPRLGIDIKDRMPYFNPGDSSVWLDESIVRFKGLLEPLVRLAELRISLMRVAEEVRKTMRRVNALEKIAIPDYEQSILYIEELLEESERQTFTLHKLVKERLEMKRGKSNVF